MILFGTICALMFVVIFWLVLPPLFQGGDASSVDESRAANLLVYQDQHRELEADLKNGLLTEAQYQQDKEELERRLLADVATKEQKPARALVTRKLGYALAVAIPIAAILFYLAVGNPKGLSAGPADPSSAITR